MKLISDAGPIIGLAKIGQIFLLKKLAAEVLIPPFVQKEIYGKIGVESELIDRALDDFIRVAEPMNLGSEISETIKGLDEGERQSIHLAAAFKKDALLLIDDRAGRQAAEELGINKTGLVGILILAKQKGYVDNISSLIEQLRFAGYWLSDEILAVARKIASSRP
jgi:predicted nucleic acid-binding protein